MDSTLPYPPSQSRLMCAAVAPQGWLPPSPQATFGAPGVCLAQGSLLNSYMVPLAARAAAPQPKNFISNTTSYPFPLALDSPMAHRNSLPACYNMAPNALFPSPTSANALHSAQPYHPLYASYNACLPSMATAAPFNHTTSFPSVSPINYQENLTSDDPSSTTVFVAGLPTCITEETLKTFFQNFGEISYVKIPPQKGYGFIKYARREDAKQAIIKMNDFPIHENSRIRLSWGRSLGDKKVEYVKKLSSALGISFESVWKIVQGQDPATIKQIASTVCGRSIVPPYDPPKLLSMSGLDQQHHAARPSNFGSVSHSHANPLVSFPSVISTHVVSSPISLHPNNSSVDASAGTIRLNESHYSAGHVTMNQIKDGYHQRPTSSCKFEPSSTCTSRPKALSQGSGPSSLPPPSWAMRNSWEELFPKVKSSQPVESPVSSISEVRLPEISTVRRATIASMTPTTSVYERVPLSQRHQPKSPGSAILSSSQASSSIESFEAPAFGLKHVTNAKVPLVEERDEYHLGCDGFLHGLLEEEGREEAILGNSRSSFYQAPRQSNFMGEPSVQDLFPWSPPSSGTDSRKFSQDDHSDWPRPFLGPVPGCANENVKQIFDSTSKKPTHLDHSHKPEKCQKEPTLGHLNIWNFTNIGNESKSAIKPNSALPSASDSNFKVSVSPNPDTGIKPLDRFWTLSL